MDFFKHLLQIFIKAWRTNKSRYGQSWGNALRYLLVTCLVFLLLILIGYDGLGDKFTELVAAAIAFLVTAVILFLWDLFLAPSRINTDQKQEIEELKKEIEPYENRIRVLNYLVMNANLLRDLETKLEKEEVTPKQFVEQSENIYNGLKEQFDKSPYGELLKYKMSDISSQNTLAPTMMRFTGKKLVAKLQVDEEMSKKISKLFMYRHNLDGIINHQSAAAKNQ